MQLIKRIALSVFVFGWIASTWARAADEAPRVQDLRCEYRADTLGIDAARPRLSWILSSDQRGQRQTAYRVEVASSPEKLAGDQPDLWDSGKVASDESIHVDYAGKPLESLRQYFWRLQVWDANDRPTAWVEGPAWTMGLLKPADWTAKWIEGAKAAAATQPTTPMPAFRKTFTIDKPVRRALIAICGLGQFELRVNGQRVSDDVLQPGWTNYSKTCLYVLYDITPFVRQGGNALSVTLGNGMYNSVGGRYTKFKGSFGPPKVIAQAHIDFADDSAQTVVTDGSWKTTDSPVTFCSIYGGEEEDARLAIGDWDDPKFDDASLPAATETEGPGGQLACSSRSAPPIRAERVLQPVTITEPVPGTFVYDMGQNCSQIPTLQLSGPAGAQVRIEPAELLGHEGTINPSSSGGSKRGGTFCVYTLRGGGVETYRPRFFYIGCRYWQVTGAVPKGSAGSDDSSKAVVQGLTSEFVTSSSPAAGEFSCSNDLFNRTNTLIRWAIRSNMVSVLTDCPHRERLGWLEQDHLVGASITYNFDVQSLLTKIAGDMAEAQHDDGLMPNIAPEYTKFKGGFLESPEWGSACVLVPWQTYLSYGDEQVLRDRYDTMRRYVLYLQSKTNTDGILDMGLGDWYDLGPKAHGLAQLTPRSLTATAFMFRDAALVAQIAKLIGRGDDVEKFTSMAQSMRDAFNKAFYDATKHRYSTGSQTANAVPLVFGLAPDGDRGAVLDDLVQDIRNHNNGLTAGDVGYRYVLRALADGGRSDVIFDMNSRDDRPGYGMILKKGATSLTEGWDGSASQDHFMLGHIMEWFYSDLVGIQQAPDSAGWKKIVIKPTPVGDVTWARAKYDSIRGPITSEWKREGGKLHLKVTIPPGATARVVMPGQQMDQGSDVTSGTFEFDGNL